MSNNSSSQISRARKAAMVVQLLLREGQDIPLTKLSDDVQLRLTKELGDLRIINKAMLAEVASEFADELGSIALTAPGSIESAMSALDGKLSPTATARLKEEAAARKGADPWAVVLGLDNEELLAILNTESVEVGAVLLSKLPTGKAAELLGLLPGELARRAAYAVSRTAGILPEAVGRIGAALAAQYSGSAVPAFIQPPFQRVGAILNSSAAQTRDSVLEGLGSEDPDFANDVRKAIFTFPDIPDRLAAPDVPKVIRDVAGADLVAALGAAQAEGGLAAAAADHILSNMSQRMADSLREEISEMGKVKRSVGEAAQSAVVGAIRSAADAGTITLISQDEEEEDD